MGYTCPRCGATSQHPDDETNEYCARCHQFESNGVQILSPEEFERAVWRLSQTADETPSGPRPSEPDRPL